MGMLIVPMAIAMIFSLGGWAMTKRAPKGIRWALSIVLGMALPVFFGWMIFRKEVGYDDPGPRNFLIVCIIVSAATSLVTITILARRSRMP